MERGEWRRPPRRDIESLSNVVTVLECVQRYKTISLPKLAAKTKISADDLDTVLDDLEGEGVIRVQRDEFGLGTVQLELAVTSVGYKRER